MKYIYSLAKKSRKLIPFNPVKTSILLFSCLCFAAGASALMLTGYVLMLPREMVASYMISTGSALGLAGYVYSVVWLIRHEES